MRPFVPPVAFGVFVCGACLAGAMGVQPPVVCIFKAATGLPCPGCGVTSSVLALCRGDIAGAWHFNPAGVAVFLFFAHSAALAVREAIASITPELAARRRLIADKVLLVCLAGAWMTKTLFPRV